MMLLPFEDRLWMRVVGIPVQNTPANRITILRGWLAFYGCWLLYAAYALTKNPTLLCIAFAILVFCGILDALDGFVAKYFGCISEAGRYLDPTADAQAISAGIGLIAIECGGNPRIMVPALGIVALGLIIFYRRVHDKEMRTTEFARWTVFAIYMGGIALFVSIGAKQFLPDGDLSRRTVVIGAVFGHGLLWMGFLGMILSALWYYRRLPSELHLAWLRWRFWHAVG